MGGYQVIWTHFHALILIENTLNIDENLYEMVTKFIDNICHDHYVRVNAVVKQVPSNHHTTTCWKKKGVKCRFNAPLLPLLLQVKTVSRMMQLV